MLYSILHVLKARVEGLPQCRSLGRVHYTPLLRLLDLRIVAHIASVASPAQADQHPNVDDRCMGVGHYL